MRNRYSSYEKQVAPILYPEGHLDLQLSDMISLMLRFGARVVNKIPIIKTHQFINNFTYVLLWIEYRINN